MSNAAGRASLWVVVGSDARAPIHVRAALPGDTGLPTMFTIYPHPPSVGGKTGTTNNFRDAWFAGYSDDLVTAIWTGNDNNEPTDRATGGGPPARIFGEYLRAAPRDRLASAPIAQPALTGLTGLTGLTVADIVEAETVEADEDKNPISAFLSRLNRD
ncbi:MAG: hypothetical protein COA58_13085 [Bacteroidetes bacterium]|nr:MAG: hypothetical protein COA58_13085 [Bacteroidota bacterium]